MAKAIVAVIDSQVAGISGDMLLSSLVDAGANKGKIINAVFASQDFLKGSEVISASFDKIVSHGFSATRFRFVYKDSILTRRGTDMQKSLARCCDSIGLDQRAKVFAFESLKTIISSEAIIHGEDFGKVHLHESSSIDTLADLIGTAVALQDLELFDAKILSTKVAVGGGVIRFSHGVVSNPANAILEIFRGKHFTLIGGLVSEELTTPTGAAMLVNIASETTNFYPNMAPEKVGYGAGKKEFNNIPNFLKIVIGESNLAIQASKDLVYVIETNVDDTTGEIIGNVIERLTEADAKDVTVTSGISKKNRPTYLIKVISDPAKLNIMLQILFEESGTLGVRVHEVERYLLARTVLTLPIVIKDLRFDVQVKIVKDSAGRLVSVKPEFDHVRIIASRAGLSVKRAMELVNNEVFQKVGLM